MKETIESVIGKHKALLLKLISVPYIPFDENLYSNLPKKPGVYRIFEKGSSWMNSIYVGETRNLQGRIYRSHLMGNRQASNLKDRCIENGQFENEEEVKQWLKEKCAVQFVTIEGETSRKNFEHFAISILKPKIPARSTSGS